MDPVNLIWAIPVFFSFHEIEEWNILEWYKKHYTNLPGSTNFSIHLHIFFFCAAAFILTLAAYLFQGTALFSLIIAFISGFILYNTFQHIVWTFQLKVYSPGLVSGILNIVVAIIVNIILLNYKMINIPYYAILALFVMPTIKTFKYRSEMTYEIRKVHIFFMNMEMKLKKYFKT